MRFADADPARPFAEPALPVLPWPEGRAAPELPPGTGGIAVRTWYGSRWDRRYPEPARNVGVDGYPLWHGWGRMVAVVEPGEHLVEVREERVEGTRLVTVRPGEVVELDYVGPRNWGADGLLAAGRVREIGGTMRPWLVAFGALMGVLLCLPYTGLADLIGKGPRFTVLAVVAIGAAIAGPLIWRLRQKRRDARYRAGRADGPRIVTGPDGRHDGVLLGDTPRAVPEPGHDHGGLLVTLRLRHRLPLGQAHAGEPRAWLPPPRLRIDGAGHPTSWSTWWYRLSPGHHAVEIAVDDPGPEFTGPREEPMAPLVVAVETVAGRTRRLTVDAQTRVGSPEAQIGPIGLHGHITGTLHER